MANSHGSRCRRGGARDFETDCSGSTCEFERVASFSARASLTFNHPLQMSTIPVDLRLAKMLVLASIFKCLVSLHIPFRPSSRVVQLTAPLVQPGSYPLYHGYSLFETSLHFAHGSSRGSSEVSRSLALATKRDEADRPGLSPHFLPSELELNSQQPTRISSQTAKPTPSASKSVDTAVNGTSARP